MPVSTLIRILIGAVSSIGVACIVAGVISKTTIIEKIKEFIKKHKYKVKSEDVDQNLDGDETLFGEMILAVGKDKKRVKTSRLYKKDEDVIGAMIREVSKNKKTVKADILNANYEVVSTEVFEGEGVSSDIYEGAIILI